MDKVLSTMKQVLRRHYHQDINENLISWWKKNFGNRVPYFLLEIHQNKKFCYVLSKILNCSSEDEPLWLELLHSTASEIDLITDKYPLVRKLLYNSIQNHISKAYWIILSYQNILALNSLTKKRKYAKILGKNADISLVWHFEDRYYIVFYSKTYDVLKLASKYGKASKSGDFVKLETKTFPNDSWEKTLFLGTLFCCILGYYRLC